LGLLMPGDTKGFLDPRAVGLLLVSYADGSCFRRYFAHSIDYRLSVRCQYSPEIACSS